MALACAATALADEPPLIPREALFQSPQQAEVRLSPDGRRVSWLGTGESTPGIWVRTIGEDDDRLIASPKPAPRRHFWMPNGEQIVYEAPAAAGDGRLHVYAVDLEGGAERDLTPLAGVDARVIAVARDFPDEVLVALDEQVPGRRDAQRIDARTAARELVFENVHGFDALVADATFAVRLGIRGDERSGETVFARDRADEPWYELVRWRGDDAPLSRVAGVSSDGSTVYLIDSRHTDTSRLYAYTVGPDGEAAYEPIAAVEGADVAEVLLDPDTGRPQAVAFDGARREWVLLDPALEAVDRSLHELGDGDLSVVDRDLAGATWIVARTRDDGPLEYYRFDRTTRRADLLFVDRPALAGRRLAKVYAVGIAARDGLMLTAYVTIPPAGPTPRRTPAAPRSPLPMVVLVHGGPWSRDRWGCEAVPQWLANRGYAVLAVNYRSSSGLGKRLLSAGDREWSGRMQDDLVDAVNAMVSAGVADPDRVAVMGGGYGGYAALAGLAFTPGFFAAGVALSAPASVGTLLESVRSADPALQVVFERRVGSLDEPEYLDLISPLSAADQIAQPLLIGAGELDPRIKEDEIETIVASMRSRDVPVTWISFPEEGGRLSGRSNLAFLAIAEAFLAQHLGGRCEPAGDLLTNSSARIRAGSTDGEAEGLEPPHEPTVPATDDGSDLVPGEEILDGGRD